MRWVKKPIAAQMKRAQTNMTYVVDGNKCANIVPQGQYFQLINSTIAGRSDGVYTASKTIPANEVIDNTYFNQTSPISEGAINKINSELTTLNSNLENNFAYGSNAIETSHNNVSARVARLGHLVIATVTIKLTSNVSAWSTIFTIKNVSLEQSTYCFGDVSNQTKEFYIGTAGGVSCTEALTANIEIKVTIPLATR